MKMEGSIRLQTFETIQIYLVITNKTLIKQLYGKIIERLSSNSNDVDTELALIDLLIAFVPHLSEKSDLEALFNQSLTFIKDLKVINRKQKKGFRIVEEICKSETDICKQLIDEQLAVINKFLTNW